MDDINLTTISEEEAIKFLIAALKESNARNEELEKQLSSQIDDITALRSKIDELTLKIENIQETVRKATLL